jgi:hypothetical protein
MLSEPQPGQESPSARVERLVYFALLGALGAGLVRTMKDAVAVLRQASAPLGPIPGHIGRVAMYVGTEMEASGERGALDWSRSSATRKAVARRTSSPRPPTSARAAPGTTWRRFAMFARAGGLSPVQLRFVAGTRVERTCEST